MNTRPAKNVDDAMRRARALKAQKALVLVNRTAKVLEIGPSYAPIASKAQGWNTFVLDHAPQEELREKYRSAPYVDVDDIEQVDFVWQGGPPSSAIPDDMVGTFDACIASHVLEHVPDPIRFLADIARLLRPDGILSLVLPDKRYELDHFRPITSTGAWLDAYERKASRHSWGTLYDCHAHAVHNNGAGFWGPGTACDYRFVAEFKDIDSTRVRAHSSEYVDAHAWVFTPSSFKLIMLELQMMGLLDFTCEAEPDGAGCEFYVSFKNRSGAIMTDESRSADRLALLAASQNEGAHEGAVLDNRRRSLLSVIKTTPIPAGYKIATRSLSMFNTLISRARS